MSSFSAYHGVCFDLDGVIIDSMVWHAKAWQRAAKELGLKAPKAFIYACEGEKGSVTARRLIAASRQPYSLRTARRFLSLKETYFRAFKGRIRLNRRLLQQIARFSRRGLPMALVTGTAYAEVRRVVPARLLRRFDRVITGDQLRRGKPHPDPYRKACRGLRISPKQCVVVENAPYGILSARRAGAGFILALASSLSPRHLEQADKVVLSTAALCRMLEKLTAAAGGR